MGLGIAAIEINKIHGYNGVERAVPTLKLDRGQGEVLEIAMTSIANKALGALREFLEDQISRGSFIDGWEP